MTSEPYIVTEKAMRPASSQRACFYCQRAIGEEHKADCVLIARRVRMRVSIEYEINTAACFTPEELERMRTEGSWCNDNLIDELRAIAEKVGCLCCTGAGVNVSWKFVEDVTAPYLLENGR